MPSNRDRLWWDHGGFDRGGCRLLSVGTYAILMGNRDEFFRHKHRLVGFHGTNIFS
ncbi:hypothetical protein BHM03_00057714 [Ensete ventricosum]|uniref:Uncharacterized protein n=1 Tax=Ensete ventricosum TaxID=4639 RepID=A0A426X160_ENSVE|nr:hypothetical protein B296_00058436 [Ensete ventricosum]RZS24629.1 hypothetical protein BHM03_00057714 [Ensete ventricosum]